MNLAWIAAVLRPHDVAPHPNFPNEKYDLQPHALLAAIVDGGTRLPLHGYSQESIFQALGDIDEGVRLAVESFQTETIRTATDSLVIQAVRGVQQDAARSCALALLACSSAAELDDYESCDYVLNDLLEKIKGSTSTDKLLRAVLLQQRCLRSRDSGQPYVSSLVDVVRLLNEVEVASCLEFQLSPGVSWSSVDTLAQIVLAVREAAWSLYPREFEDSPDAKDVSIPGWQTRVRAPRASRILEIGNDQANTFARFIDRSYDALFGNRRSVRFGGTEPDLFHAGLAFELLGHGLVYGARQELAQLRMVASERGQPSNLMDVLRLLRHANASSELDRAVEQFRAQGPLNALSSDARQILRERTTLETLRRVEYRVLQAAADLLTSSEAARALAIVLNAIADGGPLELPGHRSPRWDRQETAWLAAAELANAAREADRVASMLQEVIQRESSEDWDRVVARALRRLDWDQVSASTSERWQEWLSTGGADLPATTEVIRLATRMPLDAEPELLTFSDVVDAVNNAIRTGAPLAPNLLPEAASVIRGDLLRIRESAARGAHSFGGPVSSEVAAILVGQGAGDYLWLDLTALLVDPAVSRDDRTPAFERMARERVALPDTVQNELSRHAAIVLETPDVGSFASDNIVPYPAALRFFACNRVITDIEVFGHLAKLAGSSHAGEREEAARTAAAYASVGGNAWLVAIALLLSHDSAAATKAHAGRALAHLADSNNPDLRAIALTRIAELLDADGVLVPLLVLRELRGRTESGVVNFGIARLAADHPSRLVRVAASKLTE